MYSTALKQFSKTHQVSLTTQLLEQEKKKRINMKATLHLHCTHPQRWKSLQRKMHLVFLIPFYTIIGFLDPNQNIILRDDPRMSDEHLVLQEERTVVLLHIIQYFW